MSLKAGAFDFLQKPVDEQILNGNHFKSLRGELETLVRLYRVALELKMRFNTLSAREKEVTKLIGKGLTTKAIAERLGTSGWTV